MVLFGQASCACATYGANAIPTASANPATCFIRFSPCWSPRSKFLAVIPSRAVFSAGASRSGRDRLRQDGRICVIALAGPQAEQRLQQTFRYDLRLLIVA